LPFILIYCNNPNQLRIIPLLVVAARHRFMSSQYPCPYLKCWTGNTLMLSYSQHLAQYVRQRPTIPGELEGRRARYQSATGVARRR
jgi:hypothetical protein